MVVGDRRIGRRHDLIVEVQIVELARVTHVPRQQLHLQVAISERVEIGDQVVVERRLRLDELQSGCRQFLAIGRAANQLAARLLDSGRESSRQFAVTDLWHHDDLVVDLLRRRVDSSPGRNSLRGGQEQRMPEHRPTRQQTRRVVSSVVDRKIIEAMAREQDQRRSAALHGCCVS